MHVGILIYKILKYIGVALIRHTSPTSEKKKIEWKTKEMFSTQWKSHEWFIYFSIISSLKYKNYDNDKM